MAARGSIDLSFRADLSNLTQQLAKMPEVTTKEAKAMVKALEKQFKSAEKAAEKAAKAAEKAWKKSRDGAGGAGGAVGDLNGKLKSLSDTTGEADSAIKGFGSAVGLVSPKAEKAFFVVGELAGSVEGLSRLMIAGMGPLALVTAAVAALGGMYLKASKDLKAAEEQMQASSEAAAAMAEMFGRLDDSIADAKFDLLAAQGKKSAEEIARHTAEMRANAAVASDMKTAQEELAAAQKNLAENGKEWTTTLEGMTVNELMANQKAQEFMKAHGPAMQAAITQAANKVQGLKNKQAELADTYAATIVQNNKNKAAQKTATKSTKQTTDAIDELIKTAEGLIPDDRSQIEQMADQLAELQVAADASAPAAARLAPSIAKLNDAIGKLSAAEAADMLKEISDAMRETDEESQKSRQALLDKAAALTDVSTKSDHLKIMLADLNSELAKGTGDAENLASAMDKVKQSIENTAAAENVEQLKKIGSGAISMAQSFGQAGENLASMELDKLQKDADKIFKKIDKRREAIQDRIADIDEKIRTTTDEGVKIQLEADKAVLENRLLANEEYEAKVKKIKNKEIQEAFRVQQNMQIANTMMATATSIMMAYSQLGPIGGSLAAAGMAALGGTQVAMIESQEPPSYHLGGVVKPDEAMVKARVGEALLTKQGVNAIGGEAGVRALNGAGGPGAAPVVINQVYRHRVLDTVMSDSLKRGGSINKMFGRGAATGRQNPFRG
jgi:hypothetical protein